MSRMKSIIAVLGWEDRFLEGMKRNFEDSKPDRFILIIYEDYLGMTTDRYDTILHECNRREIPVNEVRIMESEPIMAMKILKEAFVTNRIAGDEVVLEISNMPRELIWLLLSFLKRVNTSVAYIYHQPACYPEGSISSEPDKPRLLLQHSGIADLSKRTALLIVTGYHRERSSQLIRDFEPSAVSFGIQKGHQFDNMQRNDGPHRDLGTELINEYKGAFSPAIFEVDAYSEDRGYSILRSKIAELVVDYNLIVSSLGPKLSAIAIYQVYMEFPEIALCYVPAKYSKNYSKGIGERFFGVVSFTS